LLPIINQTYQHSNIYYFMGNSLEFSCNFLIFWQL
jgi:hypothetical protein